MFASYLSRIPEARSHRCTAPLRAPLSRWAAPKPKSTTGSRAPGRGRPASRQVSSRRETQSHSLTFFFFFFFCLCRVCRRWCGWLGERKAWLYARQVIDTQAIPNPVTTTNKKATYRAVVARGEGQARRLGHRRHLGHGARVPVQVLAGCCGDRGSSRSKGWGPGVVVVAAAGGGVCAGPEAELAVPAAGEDAAVGQVRGGGDPVLCFLGEIGQKNKTIRL